MLWRLIVSDFINTAYQGLRAALQAIYSNAMRSILTTLGIIIGVTAVISVVAVMNGLSSNISRQFNDLGSDMVTLRAFTSANQEMLGFINKLTYDDFLVLKGKVKGVEDMTVTMRAYSLGASIQYGRDTIQTHILGTDSSYQKVVNVYPVEGRFLSESDDLRRRRVAFVGSSVIKKLNMPENPTGEFIKLSGDYFRVIGVAETLGSILGYDQDNYIIAPFSTIRSLNGSQVTENIEIMFRPKAGIALETIKSQMRQILRSRYKIEEGEEDYFEFVTAEKTKEQFDSILRSVTLVASGVVAISLLVGGIGIMNIMLVSVTERTKEIGIAKALGASSNIILYQFLVEALVLSLIGGVIGIALGYGIAGLIILFLPGSPDLVVPMWAVLLSFGFTTFIGVVFGLAPAIKASKLVPVEALRYE
ncbi:multidrug ABC transporter substrate-binding protein [Pseudoalteromonas byunsanensis]|uniref:Multidrug ABC transporter substrate-binding protein n=1 Tax=Pseudoalteromonas byunsanensis TaxID=327939 RepID=A0A1S1MZQ5_9GAMM|nr:multidrug ABC transporter substrate-binding protein [Pseudoalteromonas byunsanensis]